MPEDSRASGRTIWLTVDALGDVNNPKHGSERREYQPELLQKLGDSAFWIHGDDMVVRQVDFNKLEFLEWVKVWIRNVDPELSELILGKREEFLGTNKEAKEIERLIREYPDSSGVQDLG